MEYDFVSARNDAFEHLSTLFNIKRIQPADLGLDASVLSEIWLIELDINTPEDVKSIPVQIHIPADFPFSIPVFLLDNEEDKAEFGKGLNIDIRNGQICTFDQGTNIPNTDHPKSLIDTLVRKAKEILIKSVTSGDVKTDDLAAEFNAYWNDLYSEYDSVNSTFLSFINQVPEKGEVFCLFLDRPWFGNCKYILCSTTEQLSYIQNHLDEDGIKYESDLTFHTGKLNIQELDYPFNITNKAIKNILDKLDLFNAFIKYLNQEPYLPIITFSVILGDNEILLGWIPETYEYYCDKRGIQRPQKATYMSPDHPEFLFGVKRIKEHVERIIPKNFTRERLLRRTQGVVVTNENENDLDVLIAGLGSIGSNLISLLLENKSIRSFKLIDHDKLELENIYRHLLGISDIGKKKVSSVKKYIHNKDPLVTVNTREDKFISVFNNDSKFIEGIDYFFFCTGDINSENWVIDQINANNFTQKSFFIWVEPYLAGGHCLYLNGKDRVDRFSLFPDNIFKFNTISSDAHAEHTFTERELGCVTSFTPYSGINIKVFLGMLYPKIHKIMCEDSKNCCFSWIGDIDSLLTNGISISDYAKDQESFSLIDQNL